MPVTCDRIFNDATVVKLGEGASCEWPASETVQIVLAKDFSIAVGDSIFVREDTIYTQPREGAYSMASSGGVTVQMPMLEVEIEVDGVITTKVLSPEIIVTGATRIDECSPVKLTASNTYQTGGLPTFHWSLANYSDLTNKPDRTFNQTKLNTLEAKLKNATDDNKSVLDLAPEDLDVATLYILNLVVESRWGLSSTRTIELVKLNFPAPMVEILGKTVQQTNRTSTLSLLAVGKPSQCKNVNRKLGFQWTEITGALDFNDYPDVKRFSKTLVIPPFILEPEVMYNFTVDCFVVSEPTKISSASVSVEVRRSPVYVVLGSLRATRESRMITRGDILVLDARESQDPDYPTPEGQTFKGTFAYYCKDPNQMPCFEGLQGANLPDVSEKICRVSGDEQDPLIDGGKQFSRPLFDDGSFYCRYARGVLMVKTDSMINGKYKWSVEIRAYDGRTAIKTIEIEITDQKVPQVTLMIMGDQLPKYPISQIIKITGTVESDDDDMQIS